MMAKRLFAVRSRRLRVRFTRSTTSFANQSSAAGAARPLFGRLAGGEVLRALVDRGVEAALRVDGVDEAPLDGALAAHALGEGREAVGEVAADEALVDDARQAAGAGEDREERHLG